MSPPFTLLDSAANRAVAALDRLAQLHPKLIDLGLDRSFVLLDRLGNPHHRQQFMLPEQMAKGLLSHFCVRWLKPLG